MRSLCVVNLDVFPERVTRLRDRVISTQVDFFVLDRVPQPFDEHVVAPAAFAVHADRDAGVLDHARECFVGERSAPAGLARQQSYLNLSPNLNADARLTDGSQGAVCPLPR